MPSNVLFFLTSLLGIMPVAISAERFGNCKASCYHLQPAGQDIDPNLIQRWYGPCVAIETRDCNQFHADICSTKCAGMECDSYALDFPDQKICDETRKSLATSNGFSENFFACSVFKDGKRLFQNTCEVAAGRCQMFANQQGEAGFQSATFLDKSSCQAYIRQITAAVATDPTSEDLEAGECGCSDFFLEALKEAKETIQGSDEDGICPIVVARLSGKAGDLACGKAETLKIPFALDVCELFVEPVTEATAAIISPMATPMCQAGLQVLKDILKVDFDGLYAKLLSDEALKGYSQRICGALTCPGNSGDGKVCKFTGGVAEAASDIHCLLNGSGTRSSSLVLPQLLLAGATIVSAVLYFH